MARKKRKVGRPNAGVAKRDRRITLVLTAAEHGKLKTAANEIGVPLYLLARWKLTDHPIPRPPAKKHR
jgi:hypothetical protein